MSILISPISSIVNFPQFPRLNTCPFAISGLGEKEKTNMAPRPIVAATLQAALLGAVSNILAQLITATRRHVSRQHPVVSFSKANTTRCNPHSKNGRWTGSPSSSSSYSASSARPPTSSGKNPLEPKKGFFPIKKKKHRQEYLESTFPAHPPPKKKDAPSAKLSVRNTLVKFALDQTLGATVNTLLFSVFIRSLRSAMSSAPRISSFLKAVAYWTGGRAIDFSRVDFSDVLDASVAEFAAIFCAGLKLWPLVSVVNFSLVKTVEGRNLVGALAGVAWGVYMSLVTA